MKSLSQSFYSQLPQTAETQFAKTVSELQSEVRKRRVMALEPPPRSSSLFVQLLHVFASSLTWLCRVTESKFFCFQTRYKKSGRQEAGSCLYSVMPETLDTQHAKQVSQIQSQVPDPPSCDHEPELHFHFLVKLLWCSLQVKYKEEVQKELSSSLFSSLPQTLQTELAKEVTALQSQVTQRVKQSVTVTLKLLP